MKKMKLKLGEIEKIVEIDQDIINLRNNYIKILDESSDDNEIDIVEERLDNAIKQKLSDNFTILDLINSGFLHFNIYSKESEVKDESVDVSFEFETA